MEGGGYGRGCFVGIIIVLYDPRARSYIERAKNHVRTTWLLITAQSESYPLS